MILVELKCPVIIELEDKNEVSYCMNFKNIK